MGQRKNGVKRSPERIEQEVEDLREEMTPIVEELDHRRHRLMAWQDRVRHGAPVVLRWTAVAIGLLATYRVVRRIRSRRRTRAFAR